MITEFKQLEELKNIATQIIYLSNSIENASGKLNILNENIKEASVSSFKNARAMKLLTCALVFLGLAQVVVAYLNYLGVQTTIELRKQCYKSVLQTHNIDLNYKNCLRDYGLSD